MRRRTMTERRRPALAAAVVGFLLVLAGNAAADTETWNFDLTTHGEDVFYTSPTAVCTIADDYDMAYEITLLEVEVSYLGLTFGPFDVTNEIPPEFRSGSGTFAGPPPITLFNDWIVVPPPPEPPTFEAHVKISVDVDGYGQIALTSVYLGTIQIDLGWPFGVVTAQIESVRIAGQVQATPRLAGDLNGDDAVNLTDLTTLLSNYGIPSGATPQQGDLDGDGAIGLADLTMLLANYGLSC